MDKRPYHATELTPFILYADNHLLAINKPANLLTQDSGTGLFNLEDWAREWVRVDKNKKGAIFLNAVHRIDKAVSGVVLFARTSKALTRLNDDIRNRNCKKIYHALVEGKPTIPQGELIHWLSHKNHKANILAPNSPQAKKAILSFKTLPMVGNLTLLEIYLETGRYHQIRAQLPTLGTPIAGDTKYGAKQTASDGTIALHHRTLKITHPTQKTALTFTAPYPTPSHWWEK